MKRTTYLLLAFFLLAAACGKKTTNKTEELTKLKKERAELDQKIATLEDEAAKNDTTAKPTSVAVLALAPQNFNAFIEVQASIVGEQNVVAQPQAPGVVERVLVRVGQHVSKGQTLAVLDAGPVEQQIQSMDAQVTLAKQLYEKQQKLWAQNIGTQVQLLQAKTAYESQLAQRQALVAQKNMYVIKAPISGMVDAMKLTEGDMASPGNPQTGITIVSTGKLKAVASLGENYLGKVQAGDPVTLIFPDFGDSLKTKVDYVTQSVSTLSRSFGVEVNLKSDKRYHANMSAKMKIANYENSTALVIPIAAIQKTAEGEMVYIADGNKARSVIIQTGKNSNGNVEVLGGLKAGDRVITAGFEDLENGELITVK